MNERPFKLGERVLITGTGATYCNKAFRDLSGSADIDTSICYDWSNDMPVSLIREIKGQGAVATVRGIYQGSIYLVEYANGKYSIISNEYGEIKPYNRSMKGIIKYRINNEATYVTVDRIARGVARKNPSDKNDNRKGILIATARALFDEEVVQKVIDALFDEDNNCLEKHSTEELLAEVLKRIKIK